MSCTWLVCRSDVRLIQRPTELRRRKDIKRNEKLVLYILGKVAHLDRDTLYLTEYQSRGHSRGIVCG